MLTSAKHISGMRHNFQNKKDKDIVFLCFKSYIGMFYQLGEATLQSPCGFASRI